jgi:hypothetical protein
MFAHRKPPFRYENWRENSLRTCADFKSSFANLFVNETPGGHILLSISLWKLNQIKKRMPSVNTLDFLSIQWTHLQPCPISWDYPFNGGFCSIEGHHYAGAPLQTIFYASCSLAYKSWFQGPAAWCNSSMEALSTMIGSPSYVSGTGRATCFGSLAEMCFFIVSLMSGPGLVL